MVALAIILFHFALPFALLLSKERKKDGRRMIWLAVLLMFMRLVDIYWYVVPNFAHARGHFYFSLWYLVAPIGIGGLWLAFFFYNLRQRPIAAGLRAADTEFAAPGVGTWPLITTTSICCRNPAVDYDRTDLSPRGILVFLVGLLVAGIFIELVIWGMFRFLSHSPFFAKGNPSPMVNAQKVPPAKVEGVDFENTDRRESVELSGAAAANRRCRGHEEPAAVGTQDSLSRAAVPG